MVEFKSIASLVVKEEGIPLTPDEDEGAAKDWVQLLAKHGPRLIASMEFTFPGATWAFLGRDVALWSDLVEAFYLSIGQTDRVVRIAASSESFSSADGDPWLLVDYLDQHGLSLSGAENRPPFILVDTVSSGFGTQGRKLLASAYHLYRQMGGNPSQLLRKLNLFGLIVSSFNLKGNSFENAQEILDLETQRYTAGPLDYFNEHKVITYDDPGEETWVNEAGYVHQTYGWTESFGPLERLTEGRVQALPFAHSETHDEVLQMRKTILWYQKQMLRITAKPAFLKEVREEASYLGYEFPLHRILPGAQLNRLGEEEWFARRVLRELEKTEESFRELPPIAENPLALNDLLEILEPVPTPDSEPSVNGGILAKAVAKQITTTMAANKNWEEEPSFVCLSLFPWIHKALHDHKISTADLSRVLSPLLHESGVSHSLIRELYSLADAIPAFAQALETGDWATSPKGNEALRKIRWVRDNGPSCGDSIAKR